jgi:DNA-binding protein H-NS
MASKEDSKDKTDIDLCGYSADELKTILQRTQNALRNKEQIHRKETVAKIKELAASIEMNIELYPIGNARNKIPIKYQNPSNPTQAWSGRGITPRWIQDHIKNGGIIEDFEIFTVTKNSRD